LILSNQPPLASRAPRLALLVVLERLSPAERTVFVLHDVFQFSFEAVASIVGRARRRVQSETGPGRFEVDQAKQHQVAERFIVASLLVE
jgi:RNA polymerase sigma-70 factor, ECF subfamily